VVRTRGVRTTRSLRRGARVRYALVLGRRMGPPPRWAGRRASRSRSVAEALRWRSALFTHPPAPFLLQRTRHSSKAPGGRTDLATPQADRRWRDEGIWP